MENVSRETILEQQYIELLLKWNKRINLIGKNTVEDIYSRHILDSKQLLDYIDKDEKVIDVGSGAGLPGIILSINGIKEIILVESDARKSAFLTQAAMISPNKVKVINERIEDIEINADVLVARAFASISNVIKLCSNLSIRRMLLLKGQKIEEEIVEAKENHNFDYNLYPSKFFANSWIAEIRRQK